MRIPTEKTIRDRMRWLDKTAVGPDLGAKIVRQAMQYAECGDFGPELQLYAGDRLSTERSYERRRATAFEIMDHVCETYGVEYIPSRQDNWTDGAAGLEYLNTGETYEVTVIYDLRSSAWRIDNWGDIVERDNGRRFGD